MKQELINTYLLLALCACMFGGCHSPQSPTEKMRLRFNENGKFKIAQFTDLHLKHGDPAVARTLETVRMVLAAEKPDVAVLTGDIVSGMPDREPWTYLSQLFEDAKTPFAAVLGNHDGEEATKITRSEIMDILMQSPYFLGEKGPEEIPGIGNYVVPVYGRNNRKAALLYCMDSHSYSYDPWLFDYIPITVEQIMWYRRQSEKFTAENNGKPLPALAFFHVPLLEYAQVTEELFPDRPRRRISGPEYNTGLFGSFLEKRDVMGVFVGHEHGNDHIGLVKYIALGYGRITGGSGGFREPGARIIELHEGAFRFDSWHRTAKGIEQTFHFPTGISSTDEETMTYLPAKQANPTRQGVAYTYYEGRFRTVRDIDPATKVSEGVMKNYAIPEEKEKDNFAFEFRALMRIPERGVYKFYSISDDDSQVFIDGQLVMDKLGAYLARYEGKVALEAGFHDLKILYREAGGPQYLEVGYASRKIGETTLPEEILFVPE
jgi:hypothetical protein